MARQDHDAFIVATIRDGRMSGARRFHRSEVDTALALMAAVTARGDTAVVSILERSDGEGVSDLDRARLTKPRT